MRNEKEGVQSTFRLVESILNFIAFRYATSGKSYTSRVLPPSKYCLYNK